MTPPASVAKFEPSTTTLAAAETSDERIARLSKEFGTRIVALVQSAAITVTDATSCADAVALRATIGEIRKEIEAGFKPEKEYYHQKHAEVCAEEHKLIDQLIDPKNSRNPNTIDGKLCVAIQDWTAAEDRARRAEEQRLAELARQDNEARAIAEAAVHEKAGDHQMAAAVMEEAIAAPAPVVVLENVRKQVYGLKTERRWGWRFTNGPKKVKDIVKETPPDVLAKAMTLLPRAYLMPDVRTIDKSVEALKDKAAIPGVQVYHEDVPVR